MGRPRRVNHDTIRVETHVDPDTWKRLDTACRKGHVSIRKLTASLIKSWLDEPILRITYADPTLHKNNPGPNYPTAVKECIGWLVSEDKEKISLRWERTLNADKLPGLQNAAGPSDVFSVPRRSIVELRRTTA